MVNSPRNFSLRRFLSWTRLTDEHDGKLSLTNIAVIVAIVKLAVFVDAGATELVALATTLLAYGWKKHKAAEVRSADETLLKRVDSWESRLAELTSLVAAGAGRVGLPGFGGKR